MTQQTKVLLAAVIGAPNAGKSTLFNRLIGFELSIATHKVQTTRKRLKASIIKGATQVVLYDTPGIFKPDATLERMIVKEAWRGVNEADYCILLIDASKGITENLEFITQHLVRHQRKSIAVVNKIDLIRRAALLDVITALDEYNIFERVFLISAKTGDGVQDLLNFMFSMAQPGEWPLDEEVITDTPIRTIAEEITREQLFLRLHEELPYSIKVETDKWEENQENGFTSIYQSIYVLKESQKKIVIGAGGGIIKAISMASRQEITTRLDMPKVNLYLNVKVRKDWIERDAAAESAQL